MGILVFPVHMHCEGNDQMNILKYLHVIILLGKDAELISKPYLTACICSISPCIHLLFKL